MALRSLHLSVPHDLLHGYIATKRHKISKTFVSLVPFLWLLLVRCGVAACCPTGLQIVPVHPRNYLEFDFLGAHRFAFANVGAASEELVFDLRRHIQYPPV